MRIKKIILLLFCISNLSPEEILLNKILIGENNLTIIQQAANFLMLFVTKEPHEADNIINRDTDSCEISKAKTAALDAIQKKCLIHCTLEKLQSAPTQKVQYYEKQLNVLYSQLYEKLSKPYRKILYGPDKGKDLPKKIRFFFKPRKEALLSDTSDQNFFYELFGKFWSTIQLKISDRNLFASL